MSDKFKKVKEKIYTLSSKKDILAYINSLKFSFSEKDKPLIIEIANKRLHDVWFEKDQKQWELEISRNINNPNSAINQNCYWR